MKAFGLVYTGDKYPEAKGKLLTFRTSKGGDSFVVGIVFEARKKKK